MHTHTRRRWLWASTHLATLALGFALGVYALPILLAPAAPTAAEVAAQGQTARFTGVFRRDLKDSDPLHWGEGRVAITDQAVVLQGELAPGPDYKLYLVPAFVETAADFQRLKASSLRVGDVKTFQNFVVPLPPGVDPAQYRAVVVWCETFQQFITAARYQAPGD